MEHRACVSEEGRSLAAAYHPLPALECGAGVPYPLGMKKALERLLEVIYHEAETVSRLKRYALTLLRGLYHVAQKSWEDSLAQRAAALSFFTVLDLFPILVLILFGLTRNPLFKDQLNRARQFLVEQLVTPASGRMVEDLFDALGEHLDLIGSSFAGVAALVFLILVGTTLLILVEKSVNEIWRAPRLTGSFLSRMAVLWAVLTLLPLVVAGSLAVESRFAPVLSGILPEGVARVGLSFAVSCLGFWVLFILLPKTRVRALPSLAAALLSATLWEVAKQGLSLYVKEVLARSLFTKVYGSLYLIPIGLVWIYYSWLIFLFGVQCAYVFQEFHALQLNARKRWLLGKGFVPLSTRVALAFLKRLTQQFVKGECPTPVTDLVAELQLHPEETLMWVKALESKGFVMSTGDGALTLTKPAEQIALGELVSLYEETFLKSLGEGGDVLAGVPGEREVLLDPGRTLADLAGGRVMAD